MPLSHFAETNPCHQCHQCHHQQPRCQLSHRCRRPPAQSSISAGSIPSCSRSQSG